MKPAIASAALLSLLALATAVLLACTPWSNDAPAGRYPAGHQSRFEPGSITYFEEQHIILVRQTDGSFIALHDWDAWAQAQYTQGNTVMEQCRVGILSKDSAAYEGDLQAIRADYPPVDGLENIVLRAGCGNVFDPLGRHAFGPTPADLDRFSVTIDGGGQVVVDLTRQQCEPESPCLPPNGLADSN